MWAVLFRPESSVSKVNKIKTKDGLRMDHIYEHRRLEFGIAKVPVFTIGLNRIAESWSYALPEQMALSFYHAVVLDPFNPTFSTSTLPMNALVHLIGLANGLLRLSKAELDKNYRGYIKDQSSPITESQMDSFVFENAPQSRGPPSDHSLGRLYRRYTRMLNKVSDRERVVARYKIDIEEAKQHLDGLANNRPVSDPVCIRGNNLSTKEGCSELLEQTTLLIDRDQKSIDQLNTSLDTTLDKIHAQEEAIGEGDWRKEAQQQDKENQQHLAMLMATINVLKSTNVVVVSSLLQLPQRHSYNY